MVSQRKQIANQANASKSTGPRTEAGRQRSSQNRLTHGFFSAAVVLEGEDRAAYDQLLDELITEHRPQTPTQMLCVQRIADCAWKLWRLEGSAQHLHGQRDLIVRMEAAQQAEHAEEALRQRGRGLFHGQTFYRADHAQMQRALARFQRYVTDEAAPAGATLGASMVEPAHSPGGAGEFERLGRYEQRLQNMIHRAIAELRKLRGERGEVESLPPSPYARQRGGDVRDDQGDGGTSDQPATTTKTTTTTTTTNAPERNEPTTASPAAGSASATPSAVPSADPAARATVRNEPTESAPNGRNVRNEPTEVPSGTPRVRNEPTEKVPDARRASID